MASQLRQEQHEVAREFAKKSAGKWLGWRWGVMPSYCVSILDMCVSVCIQVAGLRAPFVPLVSLRNHNAVL